MTQGDCTFCDLEGFRTSSALLLENALCLFANSDDDDLLPGSGIVVPKAHRPTVFELTPAEVEATFELVRMARPLLDDRYKPDGYNLGWNCYAAAGQRIAHAHLHVLLRYADEPMAGLGISGAFRKPANRRPDPSACGQMHREFLESN